MDRSLKLETAGVRIPAENVSLSGDLVLPDEATGIVVFAHGSGSSRHSPRNRAVASVFNGHGLATLLLDLLTPDEERIDMVTAGFRFDISLLAKRLTHAVDWVASEPATRELPVALFGASTGAAAALVAAASRPERVKAVVSRGGRPDLAGDALPGVRAPTLLIVGGRDVPVIEMNRSAARRLRCEHEVRIIPGATHLFEEPGTLDEVASLATRWILQHTAPIAAG